VESCGRDDDDDDDDLYALSRQSVARTSARARVCRHVALALPRLGAFPRPSPLRASGGRFRLPTRRHVRGIAAVSPPHERAMSVAIAGRRRRRAREPPGPRARAAHAHGGALRPRQLARAFHRARARRRPLRLDRRGRLLRHRPHRSEARRGLAPETPPWRRERHRARVRRMVRARERREPRSHDDTSTTSTVHTSSHPLLFEHAGTLTRSAAARTTRRPSCSTWSTRRVARQRCTARGCSSTATAR
jgi:hypothetical protein